METPYKPINCSFYDQLEHYATFGIELKMIYLNEENQEYSEEIKIKALETKNKEEFLITVNGLRVRLDKVKTLSPIK